MTGKFKNYTWTGLPKVAHFRKLKDDKLQRGRETVRLKFKTSNSYSRDDDED